MSKLKVAFSCAIGLVVIVGLVSFTACTDSGVDSSEDDGGTGGSTCSTGYCLNNGQCCPGSAPNYTYGGHGYAAGCYASCPYVGDCGASTQCF